MTRKIYKLVLLKREMVSVKKLWYLFLIPLFLFFASFLRFPSYEWYKLLRFVVTLQAFAFVIVGWAYEINEHKSHVLSILFGCIGLLFCPLFNIHMERSIWQVIDFLSCIVFLIGIKFIFWADVANLTITTSNDKNRKNDGLSQNSKKEVLKYNVQQNKEIDANNIWQLANKKLNYRSKEYNKEDGIKLIHQAAEMGNVNAQLFLGDCYTEYMKSDLVVPNNEIAFKWYMLAAEQGNHDAQCHIASYYRYGKDPVKKDIYKAIVWYKRILGSDSVDPITMDIVKKQLEEAQEAIEYFKNIKIKAQNGDIVAERLLGMHYFYEDREGIIYDLEKAKEWLLKAAIQKDEQAQIELGKYYFYLAELEDLTLNFVQKNCYYDEALRWFSEAFQIGNMEAKNKYVEIQYLKNKDYSKIINNESNLRLEELNIEEEYHHFEYDVSKYGKCLPQEELRLFWERYYDKISSVKSLLREKEFDFPVMRQKVYGYNVNILMSIFRHICIKEGWLIDYLIVGSGNRYREIKIYMRKDNVLPINSEEEYNLKVGKDESYQNFKMFETDGSPMAFYELSVLYKFIDGLYRLDHSWYGHDDVFLDEEWELRGFNSALIGKIDIRPRFFIAKSFCVITRFMREKNGSYGYVREGFDLNSFELLSTAKDYISKVENFYCY